jgi:hypothetical protein
LRYLEFVSDVTNDIVSRGVYTNAALNHIFEYHVQKRKDILKIVSTQIISKQFLRCKYFVNTELFAH